MKIAAEIHRYVPIGYAEDYCLLGWLPLPTLEGTSHGRWAVHMAWLCNCDVVEHPELIRGNGR